MTYCRAGTLPAESAAHWTTASLRETSAGSEKCGNGKRAPPRLKSGQRNQTKGRIAAAKGFVRPWPHLTDGSLGRHHESAPNGISIGSAVFASTHQNFPTLLFSGANNSSPKIAPFPWGSRHHLRHDFSGPTRVSPPPNDISICSPVCAQLARMPNTQTHRHTYTQTTLRATSVAIGRIYDLRAMRPKRGGQ